MLSAPRELGAWLIIILLGLGGQTLAQVPPLRINIHLQSPDTVQLKWQGSNQAVVLQQNSTLAPAAWMPVLEPVRLEQGLNTVLLPATNTTRFFRLAPGMALQFITAGPGDELIPQEFASPSLACPQISVLAAAAHLSSNGLVTMTLQGEVADAASGVGSDPGGQLQTLLVRLETRLLQTLVLSNAMSPRLPWQPYRFAAPFATRLNFETNGFGTYRVVLESPRNLAGCFSTLTLNVTVDQESVYVDGDGACDPGTFRPTLLRLALPPFPPPAHSIQIRALGAYWPVQLMNFGDGEFLYAMDTNGQAAVFLPASEASAQANIQPFGTAFAAEAFNGGQFLAAAEVPVKTGLAVIGDDVSGKLGSLDKWEKKEFKEGERTVYTYSTKEGMQLGHTDNSLRTEVLWRYVRTSDSLITFNSAAELETDLVYREKTVEAARAVRFAFFGNTEHNPDFWASLYKVKDGVKPSDAVADLFGDNHTKYKLPCQPAAHYVHHRGASQALGAETYDPIILEGHTMWNAWRLKRETIFQNLTDGKPDNDHANNARWIPGDWGYIANRDTNSIPGVLLGENIIYLGGSFDTTLGDFKNNADFWGHFETNRPVRKFGEWIRAVGRFTSNAVAEIASYRYSLRQPPMLGNVLEIDLTLDEGAFAGGKLTFLAKDYEIESNTASLLRCKKPVFFRASLPMMSTMPRETDLSAPWASSLKRREVS